MQMTLFGRRFPMRRLFLEMDSITLGNVEELKSKQNISNKVKRYIFLTDFFSWYYSFCIKSKSKEIQFKK